MENPFESGHIKNYLLLYASVVLIMILFFIASALFNDVKKVEKKDFNYDLKTRVVENEAERESNATHSFKLMDSVY